MIGACVFLAGCSPLVDPNVPNPITQHLEPLQQSEYLLYRPSAYDRRDAWPLLVVCHGGFPDSPNKQIRRWTQLAERYGFIVAAPVMPRPPRGWSKDDAERTAFWDQTRQRILSVIKHVRAAHTISQDRLFIHGYGSGADAALDAGLGRPDLFRAVSVSDPGTDEVLLDRIEPDIDPYQPVLVVKHASGLLTGKHDERCIEWLRAQQIDVRIESATSDTEADAQRIIEFYETVVRTHPWLRIETTSADADDPMAVRFSLVGTHTPRTYRWDFGIGITSAVAEPIHRFGEAGTHRVIVAVDGPNGTELTRFTDVTVPLAPMESFGENP